MLGLLKNLWLGLMLIALASALLLFSDMDRRQGARKSSRDLPRLAIMQWASTDLLDHTVEGIVEGLRRQGFEHGRTANIRFFNASNDNTTGNVMARDVSGGSYDLVLTASTLALQAVAQANTAGRVVHVFGGVTDPYGAGVGITGPKPDQHPAHLVGVGTFQPVERAIRIARQMNPKLSKIGVVWNPGESNSEACVLKARATCKELGIGLVEANAGSTSEVPEAIRSILARGSEAVWVGGDTVAISSISAIVSSARAAKVPVFTNDPSDTSKGALFGVGASYQDVGIAVGEIGGKILRGSSPKSFGVENLVPEMLTLNEPLAKEFSGWSLPAELRAQAAAARAATPRVRLQPQPGRTYTAGLLYFGPNPVFEMAGTGVREALKDAGFVEGENLVLHVMHANNDTSFLPQAVQQMANRRPDILIPLSTPCLAAVLASPQKIPVVFGIVTAPLQAGAGKSFEEHLPHVTGAVWTAPAPEAFDWIASLFPKARKLGFIYNPSHDNSLMKAEAVRAQCKRHGWVPEERSINAPGEIMEVLSSLLQASPDVVFGLGDNTVVSAFSAVANACLRGKVPLVAEDNSLMGSGALFSIGGNPRSEGRHTGQLAVRVLLGEPPSGIPFEPSAEKEIAVDFEAAKRLGVKFPVDLLKRTGKFHRLQSVCGRPLRIAMVNLVQNRMLELGEAGFLRGLREAGLSEGVDFTLRRYNAQGEISQLPALLDSARNLNPDLIVTVTTPAMMAAVNRIRDVPIIFFVSSDPRATSLFQRDAVPPNITGVHDDPPMDQLLEMAVRHNPELKAVGIVYDPAQFNAALSAKKLRAACAQKKIQLQEATASALTELPVAVQALIQRGAKALLLSADNLVVTGFSLVHKTAAQANLPVFVTEANLMDEGATGAIGEDYEAWGIQAGKLAAKVLSGVPPKELPFAVTGAGKIREPVKTAVPAPRREAPARPWEIRIARYNDAQFSVDTWRGIMDGFKKQGLREGREFNVRCLNAQGDMTTLTSIMTSIRAERPDLIMTISTSTLQAALRQAEKLPVVFACVADAIRAGAGKSETDHVPNVTGITTLSPFAPMARLIRMSVPNVRAVGTLFSPGEVNAEHNRKWFAEALGKEGLKLVSVPINNSAETSEATSVMLRSDIQVVCQIMDNTARPAFAQITKRARDAGLPFFSFDSSSIKEGATLALGRDYYFSGVEAAEVAVRVLRGANPAQIPFANTRTEIVALNPDLIKKYGVDLPPEYLKKVQAEKTEE
ncbi:MAG: ABC transporter substrate-binding protein [Kiritimatiellae bacterium]|nr:ABC transporter substrate-binding protein [Kiritimatiellia bacterium]